MNVVPLRDVQVIADAPSVRVRVEEPLPTKYPQEHVCPFVFKVPL